MIYKFKNILTGLFERVDTEELANAKLAEIRSAYILQEADRFCIAKVVAVGNDFAWSNADLVNDPEDGDYRMFIHTTGRYEPLTSLSAAKIRKQVLIDEFMADVSLGTWTIAEKDGIKMQEFVEEPLRGLDASIAGRPINSVGCVSNVYVRQMNFKKTGDKNTPHLHMHDHTTLLGNGSIECSVDGNVTIFKSPVMIYIAKDKLHFFTALEDNTVAYCIHAIRDEGGDNDIISPLSIPAGVDATTIFQVQGIKPIV
jgi:hypothetical protein